MSLCSPAFGGYPASIVPAAYSSVPKTGQNRRTSRPHLALRGTRAPPTCTRTCAFEGPLGSPRRAIQPRSREKTAHDLRVGELQWPPEDDENVACRGQLAQPGFIRDGTWGVSVRRIESEEPSTRRKSGHEPAPFGTTWHYVAQDRPLHVVVGGCALSSEGVCILGFRPDLHRVQPWRPGSKRGKTRRPRGAQEGNEAACRARAAVRAAPPF